MTDVIDTLAGIAPGSALDKARNNRLEARKHAQASYDALFTPKEIGGLRPVERYGVAAFGAGLNGRAETRDYCTARLEEAGAAPELRVAVASEVVNGHSSGPYGRYPRGPLTLEDKEGMTYGIGASERHALGAKLSAAFEHTHMLVLHPRDAAPPSLQVLLDAAWS